MDGWWERLRKPMTMFSPAAHPRVDSEDDHYMTHDRDSVRGTSPAPHSLPGQHVALDRYSELQSRSKDAPPIAPTIEAKREHFEKTMASAPQHAGTAYRAWLAAHHGAAQTPVTVHPHDARLRVGRSQQRLRQKFKMQRGENLL